MAILKYPFKYEIFRSIAFTLHHIALCDLIQKPNFIQICSKLQFPLEFIQTLMDEVDINSLYSSLMAISSIETTELVSSKKKKTNWYRSLILFSLTDDLILVILIICSFIGGIGNCKRGFIERDCEEKNLATLHFRAQQSCDGGVARRYSKGLVFHSHSYCSADGVLAKNIQ